jgi:YidC/Oxa1 family membrane protein insertase
MEHRNVIVAVIISIAILFSWHFFYEKPRLRAWQEHQLALKKQQEEISNTLILADKNQEIQQIEHHSIAQGLANGTRIMIETPALKGSIRLQGARLDDLTLLRYADILGKEARVVLFQPNGIHRYFSEFGWLSSANAEDIPNTKTLWQANHDRLTPKQPVTLEWTNSKNMLFQIEFYIDQDYMINIKQRVTNKSTQDLAIAPYGLIARNWQQDHQPFAVLHEGPIGVFANTLKEFQYKDLKSEKTQQFKDVQNGWVGFSDKYWLSALIPQRSASYQSNVNYSKQGVGDQYQADFLLPVQVIPAGNSQEWSHHLFAGAKRVNLLDHYAERLSIPLFDRAVDFGMFYFLTRPMFFALQFFHSLLGNFGLAILLLTVAVKLFMYPLANRSYYSMSMMKKLQPQMEELKARYQQDRLGFQQALMQLYQREKVNPLSGCLPIIIQIPVFFSLYKVLFIALEMRHAPFYGWIHDLSAPDPTSLFNLFGLIPWAPPSFLMIGVWPLLMGITMYLQQLMNPAPSDPTQAMVMRLLPFIFTFMFASFPAGLIIYWAWNNTLSALQQWFIMRSVNKKMTKSGRNITQGTS